MEKLTIFKLLFILGMFLVIPAGVISGEEDEHPYAVLFTFMGMFGILFIIIGGLGIYFTDKKEEKYRN